MTISPRFPEPWKTFLENVDRALTAPVVLHCLGGFVLVCCYGLPRQTNDIDYIETEISGDQELIALAGRSSDLCRRHKVYFQRAAGVALFPEGYARRLVGVDLPALTRLRLKVFEAHDLVLSKLDRYLAVDREDIKFLATAVPLDLAVLESRYAEEMRPYTVVRPERLDATFQLCVDMIREAQAAHDANAR